MLAIDVRPATGLIYALGSSNRLYLLSPDGIFRLVGTGPFTPALSGTEFGFDFDPTTDRIRVVSNTGQNLRLNPDTGAVAAVDTPLAPGTPHVAALAYASNFAGATSTGLFGIDTATDQLVLLPSPNAGTVQVVGPLGADTTDLAHLDITANDGVAYAALTVGGATRLYTVNLSTGAATLVGPIFGLPLRAFTVLSRGVPMLSLRNGSELVRFHSATPSTILATIAVSGLQAGESLVGIDIRPSNGQLYGVGSTSRLYRINTITRVAAAVGGVFAPPLVGTRFGVDFDPLTDRLRILGDTQQHLRLDADTGLATVETPLSPATAVAGAAFNSNVDGARFVTLYALDAQTDSVTSQDQLGDGTLVRVGPLGVDTSPDVGFDISPLDGVAFASLTVGGVSGLYTVNLFTGAAQLIGPIGTGALVNGLAVVPVTYQFAEGSTGAFFDTDILLANPTSTAVSVTVSYQTELSKVVTEGLTLPPQSRTTVSADANALLGETAFATTVTSHLGTPIAVERTMRWDPTGYGMHGEKASPSLARTWYFAEGSQGFYDTFFLLTNPTAGHQRGTAALPARERDRGHARLFAPE